ncbi:MAG: fatty acid cis/trans isomerase [Myxococcota bacterium]|nr:fatty acid cis/trans isomerase [Myxococcota bacterium]
MKCRPGRGPLGYLVLAACLASLHCGSGDDWTEAEATQAIAAAKEPVATFPAYLKDVQPIFDARCIACHSCLGSPCNVNLTSFAGADRGGSGKNPYSIRMDAVLRTGMNVHTTTEAWREVGFWPVVSRGGDAKARLAGSLLSRQVHTGYEHNQPGFSRKALMPSYEDRYEYTCPATPEELAANLAKSPAQGMPYGVPALEKSQLDTLNAWVASGSPGPLAEELAAAALPANLAAVAAWESFFNRDDDRMKLVSRYIFDHTFLASIALKESPGDSFRLVRSKTPTGRPVEVIDTPHPYDDPKTYAGVDTFFYRLKKQTVKPVQKNHFIWELSSEKRKYLEELFLDVAWEQGANPSPPWGSRNPFETFAAIPVKSRYRFLIENSAVIVGGITSGPVCLGQAATYAVKDHFWVYFVDPDKDISVIDPMLGLSSWEPFMDRSPEGNHTYEEAYTKALRRIYPEGYSIDEVWDGNQENPNAWLTVLRHESNTWVMQGAGGGMPRTLWLMGYSGFERIYYDTVAHFEYWGGDADKLETVGFFNFLRQQFEDRFLLLVLPEERERLRKDWSQGIGRMALWLAPDPDGSLSTRVKVDSRRPLQSVVQQLRQHLGPVISGPLDPLNPSVKTAYPLEQGISSFEDWRKAISTLTVTTDYKFPRFLPSVSMLKLNSGQESRLYSLIANRVYKTQYTILFENGEALPDLDTLSVYEDVVGGFPNLFVEMDLAQAADFVKELSAVTTLGEFIAFRDKYAVLRNSEKFWEIYDWFNAWNFQHRGIAAGVFDLSYYDLFDHVY